MAMAVFWQHNGVLVARMAMHTVPAAKERVFLAATWYYVARRDWYIDEDPQRVVMTLERLPEGMSDA